MNLSVLNMLFISLVGGTALDSKLEREEEKEEWENTIKYNGCEFCFITEF